MLLPAVKVVLGVYRLWLTISILPRLAVSKSGTSERAPQALVPQLSDKEPLIASTEG